MGTLQNKQASQKKKKQNFLYFKKGIVRRGQKKSCNFMHGKLDPFYTLKAILFLKIQVFQIIWFIEVSGYCWPKAILWHAFLSIYLHRPFEDKWSLVLTIKLSTLNVSVNKSW